MSMRMLIDARHPEETRVAVVNGNRIEEFDFEAADRKQLKGNIYLAKVTRVEPSLQAAFIEYGGNRHGFLAFSEIHPDYYQIPKEDRDALLREEREAHAEAHDDHHDDHHDDDAPRAEVPAGEDGEDHPPEETGAHDETATEALRKKRMNLRRRYKIQDVIRRRQVLLVQVVKEERGNKGAAMTTYLSLAGRYCVLMPNTAHGGGISRKISSVADRKRLKTIMADMQLPAGMGCIVRTAGLSRTKTEIKRDFDYLCRLWDGIRETTLASSAPALIHQDSDLIKRAIRDIYSREIEQVLVDGEGGYKAAKTFMKLLMPSHAAKVQQYVDPTPLFQRFGVEGQLAAMYQPVVQLKSGGYIVINPTEALVSIDINSGRSTREHDIEGTATKTNIEAAEEIARQLRLRDMAGLVVIDFIDMDVNANNRKVERAMKEALKNDRARIQIGRISSFGLMEMSRQRLRTGVLEASTHTCSMCEGTGLVRTIPSVALAALRGLEEEAVRGKNSIFTLRSSAEVAVYILNRKRSELAELEERYGVEIDVLPDEALVAHHIAIDTAGGPPSKPLPASLAIPAPEAAEEDEPEVVEIEAEGDEEDGEVRRESRPRDEERGERSGRGRRRRRGRGRRSEGYEGAPAGERTDGDADAEGEVAATASDTPETREEAAAAEGRRRRRRGRRGGRRREGEPRSDEPRQDGVTTETQADVLQAAMPEDVEAEAVVAPVEPPAKPKRASRAKKTVVTEAAPEAPADVAAAPEPIAEAPVDAPAKPKRASRAKKPAVTAEAPVAEAPAVEAAPEPAPETAPAPEPANDLGPELQNDATPPRPSRKGWWNRTFGE